MAAMLVAVSAVASTAAADEPNGLSPLAKRAAQEAARNGAQKLEISRVDALERWRLTASSASTAWDPTDAALLPRFDSRQALSGGTMNASLAFDWQRKLAASRIEAAAFAKRSAVELFGNEALYPAPERFEQRDARNLFGAAVRWSADGGVGDFDTHHSAAVRVRAESFDSDGSLVTPGRAPLDKLREDRLRQSGAGLNLDNEVQLSERVRAVASTRYDTYRFGVRSDLAGHSGDVSGGVLSPHVALIAELSGTTELFLRARRGYEPDDPRSAGALADPRSGVPVARLDPLATAATTEVGVRGRWLPGVETTLSMFRMKAETELLLTGISDITEIGRPTQRQGVQLAARYEPAAWLALDLQASALRARFADGGAGYVPGAAERTTSAAATMRVPNGWTASLVVNYLGSRPAVDENATRLKSSSFVNARLTRNLSKETRVTLDVFNIFDHRVDDVDYFSTTRIWNQPGADSFLFNPAEPRGFRIKLRTTF